MNCQLVALDDNSPVDRFDPPTGDLVLRTNDSQLNGQTLDFRIDCISSLSKVQNTYANTTFSVGFEFENCNSIISLNSASMADQTQYWMTSGRTTAAVPEYAYSADCELEFSYSALVRMGTGDFMPIESIKEITFDPESRTFYLAKCDPADPDTTMDPHCSNDPFFFTYEVAVKATLNDGVGTSNQDLTFKVTFGPDCTGDEVTFTTPIPDLIEYYISIPPVPMQLQPVVT